MCDVRCEKIQIDYQKFKPKHKTDFNNISWEFRGPENNILAPKSIIDIANDPNNDAKIWICTTNGELFYNDNLKDAKSEWKKATLNQKIYKIRFDINKSQTAYAIGDFVIWKTIDGGKTWAKLPLSPSFTQFLNIWVSRNGNLIAATKNEIYLSADEGKSWKQLLITTNFRTVKQLWVQENERIYVDPTRKEKQKTTENQWFLYSVIPLGLHF